MRTFDRGALPRSRMVTWAAGSCSLQAIAAKKPAAPPPAITTLGANAISTIDRKSTRLNSSHVATTLPLHDALPILNQRCRVRLVVRDITAASTGDAHFRQGGFAPLEDGHLGGRILLFAGYRCKETGSASTGNHDSGSKRHQYYVDLLLEIEQRDREPLGDLSGPCVDSLGHVLYVDALQRFPEEAQPVGKVALLQALHIEVRAQGAALVAPAHQQDAGPEGLHLLQMIVPAPFETRVEDRTQRRVLLHRGVEPVNHQGDALLGNVGMQFSIAGKALLAHETRLSPVVPARSCRSASGAR